MKTEQGSAHFIIIIVLVLSLITALGWIFWQNFIYEAPPVTNVDVVKVDQNDTKSDDDSPAQSPESRLQELYSKYLADTSSYKGDSELITLKQTGYITADYVTENNSGEPLVCGQEAYPDNIEVKLVDKVGSTAKLTGKKIYKDGSNASNSLELTMSLSSANQWQLKKTNCVDN